VGEDEAMKPHRHLQFLPLFAFFEGIYDLFLQLSRIGGERGRAVHADYHRVLHAHTPAEMLEVMGNGMECIMPTSSSKPTGHAQGDLPILGDHGIRA
jgi:hypothetical protein